MGDLHVTAAIEGLLLGLGLIVAIGAQNAFVLRQGLLRRHVFAVVAVCTFSDIVLIAAGVAGLGRLVQNVPSLLTFVTVAGAAFLLVYGATAFHRAFHPGKLIATGPDEKSLAGTLATCLALTFLNPHVYLDTVVLIGAISARYEAGAAIAFGAGASLGSMLWFLGLGYGAALLTPVFSRPAAWRVLDVLIGVIMWAIAGRLVAEIWR